jgi:hypothetical protein
MARAMVNQPSVLLLDGLREVDRFGVLRQRIDCRLRDFGDVHRRDFLRAGSIPLLG